MSLIMLASLGTFPPPSRWPACSSTTSARRSSSRSPGIVLVVTVLAALTQKSIRDFGTAPAPEGAPAPQGRRHRRLAPRPPATRLIMAV